MFYFCGRVEVVFEYNVILIWREEEKRFFFRVLFLLKIGKIKYDIEVGELLF